MHILVAPNAFKNSLDAKKAAIAISDGLLKSKLSCTTTLFPVADGGDGTADLLIDHLQGEHLFAAVHDPLGRMIKTSFGWSEKYETAIIELATASGLRLLKPGEYDPIKTSTRGTGELIREALNKKPGKIILCIGGSATVDGGVGILGALGVKFLDQNKNVLNELPISLSSLDGVDLTHIDKRVSQTEIFILCDVENPLLGINGAARIFGPQKGALEKDVEMLEARLANFNKVVMNATGKDISAIKHGGAAGGVAAGLYALLNAQLKNGIDHYLELTGFERELKRADLVITGEGSIDLQTLQGKAPFGVARKAKELGLPVIALGGNVPSVVNESLREYFDQLISINQEFINIDEAIKNTYQNLEKTAMALGDQLSSSAVQN